LVTQLWPEGVPIKVKASDGLPQAIHWQGRWHAVRAVVEQWVVHDEWWRDAIWRHYFQVEISYADSALLCVLYHDLLADAWSMERIYD
jgi:hypothetical protein